MTQQACQRFPVAFFNRLRDKVDMTREQCRAARALLDWTQPLLAKKAAIGESTVRDFEAGRRSPHQTSLDAIRKAFERAGIQFIERNGGGPGVRLKK